MSSEEKSVQVITDSDDLVVKQPYWLKDKSTGKIHVDFCEIDSTSGWKYFGNKIWTDNENPQGFERWHIVKFTVPDEIQSL